jgi:hypothetical protein
MGRLNNVRTRSHDHSYLLAGPVVNELVGEGKESDRMKKLSREAVRAHSFRHVPGALPRSCRQTRPKGACSSRGANYVKKSMPVQHFVNPTLFDPELDLAVRRSGRYAHARGTHFEDIARYCLAIPT